MTQDEFFRDPVPLFLDGRMEEVPDEWVRQAWDTEQANPEQSLRHFVTSDIGQEASKGCLPLIAGQLRWLGQVLREDQWEGLYREVRDQEPHREAEIREEFVRAAPGRQACLSSPLTREAVIALLGSEEIAREMGVFDN
jgi:hypothetical protein